MADIKDSFSGNQTLCQENSCFDEFQCQAAREVNKPESLGAWESGDRLAKGEAQRTDATNLCTSNPWLSMLLMESFGISLLESQLVTAMAAHLGGKAA